MSQEIIKKTRDRNEYLLIPEEKMWVRNFYKPIVPYTDINNLVSRSEYDLFLSNELENWKRGYPDIGSESIEIQKIVVVSDGYGFIERHKLLCDLPSDVAIIAVNKVLSKWSLKAKIDYYVVNNPFPECMSFLPKKYFPRCVASNKTNPRFLSQYKGNIWRYSPVSQQNYSGMNFVNAFKIDDYRNPICAAIGLSMRFGVKKLMLFCCDDSFEQERDGSVKLENGLWSYPQQITSQRIIDANLYWMKENRVETSNYSSGERLKNAAYITPELIKGFFEDGNT